MPSANILPLINLNAVLDSIPDGMVVIALDHTIQAFNKAFQNYIYDYQKKTVAIGADYRELIIPRNLDLYLSCFAQAINGETAIVQNKSKTEGFSVWVEFSLNPIYDSNDTIAAISLRVKNIEEARKMEVPMTEKVRVFEAMLENTSESVLLLGMNCEILYFNQVAFHIIKRNVNKGIYLGANFNEFVYEGKSNVFDSDFKNALNGNNVDAEILITNINGQQYWFHSRMYPMYDKTGEQIGVSLLSLQISDKKLAAIAIKESEEKFRNIFSATLASIVIINAEKNIIESNPSTEHIFGYNHEELLNQSIGLLFPIDLSQKNIISTDQYGTERNVAPAITKNGEEIIIEIFFKSITIAGSEFTMVIIQDVTKKFRDEMQIANQLERLKKIAWQQSHEVRGPLTNIMGLINLISFEKDLTSLPIYLNHLKKASHELDLVIKHIVKYTDEEEDL